MPATEKASVPADTPPYGNGSDNDLWFEQSGNVDVAGGSLRIPVPLLRKNGHIVPEATPIQPVTPLVTGPVGSARIGLLTGLPMEAVHIDQTTLGSRPGYKPDFIGTGKFTVPLPKIPASLRSKIATLKSSSSKSELKYFNYSVVMNKERKLAFFSAVNIDGGGAAGRRQARRRFLAARPADR